ncbi:fungal chitosanase of glycosyl hydrolase group 75-domain-containing protein [Aspergillus egyptiacus]|nr:fungal chitosanase of glycosyl hydrolase group 75-domain-containing protein [Aspergillus egyptiacus]
MLLFNLTLLSFLLLTTAKRIPPNLRSFYHTVRHAGNCTGSDLLKGGFYDQDDSLPLWGYCQRYITGRGLYLKGPDHALANMDIDCDGLKVPGDGRCNNSRDTQYETAFKEDVRKFGIPDLNPYVHPYVVLGNVGRYTPTFDPRSVGVRPLSVVAVVCANKLIYGIWGDVNGDDGLPLVGEASLALATACFGHRMNGDNGHDAPDVLYLAFAGDEAVPGYRAKWHAKGYKDFERSIERLGDRLVARVGASRPDHTDL